MRPKARLCVPALTAVLLLGLTAFDLGSDIFDYVACPLCTSSDEAGGTPLEPHRDDCFCCSHCVRPSAAFELERLPVLPVPQRGLALETTAVSPHEFFHPPRLA